MRIQLLRPPTVNLTGVQGQIAVAPIGLAYVAGSLRAAGHEVVVLDAVAEAVDQYLPLPGVRGLVAHGLTPAEVAARIDPAAELVGMTSMFSMQWSHERKVLEAIGAARPDLPMVLGGEHPTATWDYLLRTTPAVDYCVLGEGEQTIVALAAALARGTDPREVEGLALRSDGVPERTGTRRRIREIDEIPPPAWDLFPVETYIRNDLTWGVDMGRSMPILASRGCPYQCTFCSSPAMWTTYWGARSPSAVIAEIKDYMQRYDARCFNFYDLTAIVRRDWIVEFTNLLLAEQLDITWQLPSGTRTEVIDAEVAALLYRSGCRHLNYAPESGSADVLRRIKKKIKPERMLESMRDATEAGLRLKVNLIFGFPDDSWRDVRESYAFVIRTALAGAHDMGPYPFSPYPGTELFDDLARAGELALDDEYFRRLMVFADPRNKISFARHFGARTLSLIIWGSVVLFYGASFLRRPWRFFQLVRDVVTRRRDSKLTKQLAHARRKRDALRHLTRNPLAEEEAA